jgi:16S rRNA C967 or C1407 C5-methylase (RsmB/RsmF family)
VVPSSLRGDEAEPARFATLLPHKDGCDGFFAAVFERAAA